MPTSTPSGRAIDIAIDGVEFRCAPTPQRPYQRGLADQRRQQFDSSTNPGEQSLAGFWLRSQQDFTAGAGGTFMEPSNDEWAMRRFQSSMGVDVFTRGRLSLLNDTLRVRSLGAASAKSVVVGDYYYTVAGSQVYANGAATATVTGWTSSPRDVASTGDRLLVGHDTGIDTLTAGSGTPASLWTGAASAPSLWWVKQRIIAAIGPALYELSLVGGALPAAYYTHPLSGWTWTSAVDTPGAILVSGYSGSRSAIYRITVDNTGALPTLTKATTVAELPNGEIVTGMFSYLGSFVMIGTNKGVRVGEVDPDGNLVYGPLSFTSTATTEITGFAGKDRFVYVGVGAELDGSNGLIRIDLSSTDGQGRYAWANDLACSGAYRVRSIGVMPATGLMVFTGGDLFAETPGQAVASGYVKTGMVRFNTLEAKQFRTFRVWGKNTGGSSVTAQVMDENGTLTDSATYTSTFDVDSPIVTAASPVTSLGLKITLTSASSGTQTPTVSGWLMRAVPAAPRRRLIRVPLQCFDRERDVNNVSYGHEGFAWERITAMETAAGTGRLVSFQDFRTGESMQVTVEQVEFTQVSAGTSKDGFGGMLEVTVQTA